MNKFKEKILRAIKLCNEELVNRKNGVFGESTEEQLKNIILPELTQLLTMLNSNQLPAKEQRYLNSFANAFTVWGWNMQEPTEIFVLLTELNNEYKNLKV
ncbi:MAG: hypothetical protein K2H01_09270 [Ruminococcus sp.]|nr:hypothetical protein [Ruminococcus sp.]